MKKYLFSSRAIRAIAVGAAVAAVAVPASSASASLLSSTTSLLGTSSTSSTLLVTAQGTSILGQEVPVLGTQGWYITLPVSSNVLPGETIVWDAIDFTVTSDVTVGSLEIANLYVDPKMAY